MTSPKVRLALASALQRLQLKHRWAIAEALMGHADDAQDPYLPLMIWYGVEPLVNADNAGRAEAGVRQQNSRCFDAISHVALWM